MLLFAGLGVVILFLIYMAMSRNVAIQREHHLAAMRRLDLIKLELDVLNQHTKFDGRMIAELSDDLYQIRKLYCALPERPNPLEPVDAA
jgi:hypothetical protein